ncbi:MAG: hypothetical protein FWG63_05025 [Defluviitaleaceae bacterium]|nr:hypothetical protein [Defluviitaleaceae bacterium]
MLDWFETLLASILTITTASYIRAKKRKTDLESKKLELENKKLENEIKSKESKESKED